MTRFMDLDVIGDTGIWIVSMHEGNNDEQIKSKPRFLVFLDLKKAYRTLRSLKRIEILKAYGLDQTYVI